MFRTRSISKAAAALFIAVITALGQTTAERVPPSAAELQEIRNYRLSTDKLEKYVAASKRLITLAKTHPEIRSVTEIESIANKIDDTIALMESKFPQAANAIQISGLTVREYFLTGISLLATTIAVALKKQGQMKERKVAAAVSPENLAFVEQNYDKIEKMIRDLSQMNSEKP